MQPRTQPMHRETIGSSPSSGTGPSSSRRPRSPVRCARSRARCSSTPASTTTTSSRRSSSTSWSCRGPEHRLDLGGGTNTEQTARMLAALEPLLASERARARARLRRHELDARGRARRRAGRRPGRARRGGHALLRPHDARGAQPRAHRPRERPAAVLRPQAPAEILRGERVAGEVEVVGDVMVDVAQLLGPRARGAHRGARARSASSRGGYVLATAHRAGNVDDPDAAGARSSRLLRGGARAGRAPAAPADARRGSTPAGLLDALDGVLARAAARLPRLHRAAAQRARRAHRLGRRAEGGLPRRRPVRDAARRRRSGPRRSTAGWNVLVDLDARGRARRAGAHPAGRAPAALRRRARGRARRRGARS